MNADIFVSPREGRMHLHSRRGSLTCSVGNTHFFSAAPVFFSAKNPDKFVGQDVFRQAFSLISDEFSVDNKNRDFENSFPMATDGNTLPNHSLMSPDGLREKSFEMDTALHDLTGRIISVVSA